MELSRFLRPSILKFDDWFINVSIGGTGGEDSNIQKDVYFSGKNAYLYASTGSGVTELHIFGNSVQDGTPSIENPVPIISVGENYLQLYSLDINDPSKSGQIIDFGNIKLRSLPNGVCDEIVYQNGQWKHIQRIVSIIIDKNTTIQDQLAASNRVTIQVNYTLITKASANNTNLCSKISNSTSSVPRFHNYPTTIYVVWDSNKPATFKEAKSLIMGAEFLCELAEPVETILDLPKLQTLNGTTYLLTNDQQVKPYLQGYYDVDTTISGKKIEYIQDGMLSWWQPFGLTNADKPTVIPDKLGNHDLTIRNLNYTNESGFHPTYLQFDGIDDYARAGSYTEPIISAHATVSNLIVNNINISSHWVSIFDSKEKTGISISNNKAYHPGSLMEADCKYYKDGELTTDFTNIINNDNIVTLGLQYSGSDAIFNYLNISNFLNDSSYYKGPERFYEAIAYDRILTDEEVQNNFLVSQIRNGINIPNDIDPIDIISTPTYGSGKAFPVYNTYIDKNNNNVESLIICGYTEQDGTPTSENPIELKSVGDQSLVLCIYNEDKSKVQYIDFGDIVLRSLPDGTCDSIEWDGTQWKYIQRIGYVKMLPSNFSSIGATGSPNNTYNIIMYNNDTNIISNDFKYTSINAEWNKHYLNNKFVYSGLFDEANSFYIRSHASAIYLSVITDKPTKEEFSELIGNGFEFIGELAEPIETILEGIPAPQTYDQVTYFSTPNTEVRPYIMATVKAIKPLEYQGDISAWWYFGGNKSNETDRQITDLSGNENDLIPYNVIWTRESGFNQGWFHFDAIDDYAQALLKETIQANDGFTIQLVVKNFSNNIGFKTMAGFVTNVNGGATRPQDTNRSIGNVSSIATITNKYNFRVVCNLNKQINANNYKDNTIYAKIKSNTVINANGNSSTGIPDITDKSDNDFRVGYSGGDYFEILLLKGYVNEDIIENNKKLLLQRNGIEDHVNFTAIASGKKFPIYYTIEGDTIKELHIYGESMQEGTPTIDTPQEIYSSGDEGLKLCITDSETNTALQIIDFGDIVLRSLPSGVCDEIVYRDKQWRYIQRVYHTYISNAYYHNTTAKFAMVNLNPTYGGLHNNQNYVMSNRFIIGSFENMSNNIGISYINAVNNTYAFNFENEPGTNDHVQEWLANNPTELIYQLAEPIETVLDLPDITTYADITYIGTPNAKVKPYIECVAETYKSLEFVKDGLVELYDFAPSKWQDNKIYNEIDNSQYITANNFNNTIESGAFSNYTQFDGIDDYFTDNNNVDSIFFQIYATDLVGVETENRWLLAYDLGVPNTGLFINNNTHLICNNGLFSIDEGEKNNNIPRDLWGTGIHSYQGFSNSVGSLSCIGNYNSGDFYIKYKLYALLTYSSELTSEQIEHNLNCFKQLKGIDGNIDISNEAQLLDSQGNELTDSQGYYLTVAS